MNPTVILIDDYRDVTEVISEYLEFHSINVLATARDGKQGAELYKEYMPDVVVSDFLMPKYNGLYGLEMIRKINPDAKVIMMTGSIDENLHDELRTAGASVILPKPTPLNTLIETIKRIALENTVQASNHISN